MKYPIKKVNQQLAEQRLTETQNGDELKREVVQIYTEPAKPIKKKDHMKEMRNGVIYFGISLALMAVFVFTVLRPFEQDMVSKAHKEYSELLKQSKALAKDYNKAMELLRKSYRRGQ